MMSVSDWNMPDDKPGLVKALKVDVRHELDGVVLVWPAVVRQGGEVQEVLDAGQVRAHRPRAASVLQATSCAQVPAEVVTVPGAPWSPFSDIVYLSIGCK